MHSRMLCASLMGATAVLLAAGSAGATPVLSSHGQLIHLQANTNQSSNWFGFNQGTLEKNDTLFNSIAGDWTVPTPTQHSAKQAEYSSDWIGIGGGCVDAGCTVGDNTLIQTGTEQDVSGGTASYSAWWELVPAPSITISGMTIHPGDHMHASVAETVAGSNVWNIQLRDVTTGQSFSTTAPYSSTHATAEWIEETPLVFGTGGAGLAALPNLTNTPFTSGTTNGANANLKATGEIQLIDSSGKVIGTPSAPNGSADGFTAGAWATSR